MKTTLLTLLALIIIACSQQNKQVEYQPVIIDANITECCKCGKEITEQDSCIRREENGFPMFYHVQCADSTK